MGKLVILLTVIGLVLVLAAFSVFAQQPPAPMPIAEYKTVVGCYIVGVLNPGALQGGVQGMLNDNAKGGWIFDGLSVWSPGQGSCAVIVLRKTLN